MPNVAEIIREHVTLDVKCVDRLYLDGYIPRLQSEGGVVAFRRPQPEATVRLLCFHFAGGNASTEELG